MEVLREQRWKTTIVAPAPKFRPPGDCPDWKRIAQRSRSKLRRQDRETPRQWEPWVSFAGSQRLLAPLFTDTGELPNPCGCGTGIFISPRPIHAFRGFLPRGLRLDLQRPLRPDGGIQKRD